MDINSGTTGTDSIQTNIVLQTNANAVWAGTTEPTIFDVDTSIVFIVNVTNSGEALIELDSTATALKLLTTPYNNILLSGKSPTRIASGDTVSLIFKETFITGVSPADYVVQADLNGISTGRSFSQSISAGQINIGGQVSWGTAVVTPNQVNQGENNIHVLMNVRNDGAPLSIDTLGTTILFKNLALTELFVDSLRRVDTLTVLRSIPNNALEYEFNVPADFETGDIGIYGQISLDNSAIVKQSATANTTFNVISGSNIVYAANSAIPTSAVPNETVRFILDLN